MSHWIFILKNIDILTIIKRLTESRQYSALTQTIVFFSSFTISVFFFEQRENSENFNTNNREEKNEKKKKPKKNNKKQQKLSELNKTEAIQVFVFTVLGSDLKCFYSPEQFDFFELRVDAENEQ